MDIKVDLVNRFDLRRMGRMCNIRECRRLPQKEVILLEVSGGPGKKARRELASLYLCENHHKTHTDMLLKALNTGEGGTKIDKKVNDIGYITG